MAHVSLIEVLDKACFPGPSDDRFCPDKYWTDADGIRTLLRNGGRVTQFPYRQGVGGNWTISVGFTDAIFEFAAPEGEFPDDLKEIVG